MFANRTSYGKRTLGKRAVGKARELTPGIHMHSVIVVAFLEISRTVVSTCSAGILFLLIALWAAKTDIAQGRGLDKIVALSNLCFAVPLAVFGAEHFAAAKGIMQLVPKFMPWPLFWTYLVGVGLVAASLSIATRIQVRWSGLLIGIMMFLFVAMMDIPGVYSRTPETGFHGRWLSEKCHSEAEAGFLRETRCANKGAGEAEAFSLP